MGDARGRLALLSRVAAATLCLALTLYASLVVFDLGVWPVDDFVASKMSDVDWLKVAAANFLGGALAGLFIGLLVYVLLRFVWGWKATRAIRTIPFFSAVLAALIVIGAALASSILFFWNKPWF